MVSIAHVKWFTKFKNQKAEGDSSTAFANVLSNQVAELWGGQGLGMSFHLCFFPPLPPYLQVSASDGTWWTLACF